MSLSETEIVVNKQLENHWGKRR